MINTRLPFIILFFIAMFFSCNQELTIDLKIKDADTNKEIADAKITVVKMSMRDLIPNAEVYLTDEKGACQIFLTKKELRELTISCHVSKQDYYSLGESQLYINDHTDFSAEHLLFLSKDKSKYDKLREREIPKYGLATFLNSLKQGEKLGSYMPKFSYHDIDSLLSTGLEDDIIDVNQFENGKVSAKENYFFTIAKLWIIESIRHNLNEPTSGVPIFANLYFQKNNDTIKINPENGDWGFFDKELAQIFGHYQVWWSNKSQLKRDSLLKVNPLEATGYEWK